MCSCKCGDVLELKGKCGRRSGIQRFPPYWREGKCFESIRKHEWIRVPPPPLCISKWPVSVIIVNRELCWNDLYTHFFQTREANKKCHICKMIHHCSGGKKNDWIHSMSLHHRADLPSSSAAQKKGQIFCWFCRYYCHLLCWEMWRTILRRSGRFGDWNFI